MTGRAEENSKIADGARIVSAAESQIRLSARGEWFHRGEPFENRKIIDFFHRAIRRDEQGRYFLHNAFGNKQEAVYFEVEDTAYFVRDLALEQRRGILRAWLNTGQEVEIDPHSLVEDDRGRMYCRVLDDDRALVTPRALNQLADLARMDDDGIHLPVGDRWVTISKGH